MENENLELFASCLAGLEAPLAEELKRLGVRRVRPLSGGLAFFADARHALAACLWSRLASRIMLVVGRVDASDADALYDGVRELPWEEVVAPTASMAVGAHGMNEELRNTRFTALKVKDAVCDRLRQARGRRPDVDAAEPGALLDVRVRERRATLSLDLAGSSLYRRSYLADDDGAEAPLQCALAAGLLALAGWKGGSPLVDPACGDGALLVEAAAAACDLAPGLARERWGFFGWAGFDEGAWSALLAEADARFERGLAACAGAGAVEGPSSARPDLSSVRLVGFETSSPAIARARARAKRAGLRQAVSIERGGAGEAGALAGRVEAVAARFASLAGGGLAAAAPPPARGEGPAKAVASPSAQDRPAEPFFVASVLGARERASEAGAQADAAAFAAAAGAAPARSLFAVAGGRAVEEFFERPPRMRAGFGRDRVAVEALVYDEAPASLSLITVPDSAGGSEHRVAVLETSSAQFAARLFKVARERRKWARREGVSCYRVYDADLPGYAVAIDRYGGAGDAAGNEYLHLAEYAPPASIDPVRARRRFDDVLALAPVALGVRADHVFAKTRRHEKGGSQYRDEGRRGYVTQVQEDGYLFEVDLSARLDTGLFLDHRDTRRLLGSMAASKRFLNLFAYTGTATVHAAGGGASETLTVDLSQGYLDWARRNMQANGFVGPAHGFERADTMTWISEARRAGRRFDLVFVDTPTFSNSKAMGRRTWDVQRDHVELLIGVSRLLSEQGEALFSCNLRSFKLDEEALARYGVVCQDVTAQTIPPDFERRPRIHRCYLVKRDKAAALAQSSSSRALRSSSSS